MTYYNDKHLFINYDKEHYKKILENKKNNCVKCEKYKVGKCKLLKIKVSALYICPHFEIGDKKNG